MTAEFTLQKTTSFRIRISSRNIYVDSSVHPQAHVAVVLIGTAVVTGWWLHVCSGSDGRNWISGLLLERVSGEIDPAVANRPSLSGALG